MNIKSMSKLSKIVDKMGLDIEEIAKKIQKKKLGQEAMGMFVIGKIVPKLHLVENDIVEFIMSIKNISKDEAEKVDVIEFIKTDLAKGKIQDFFK